MYYFLFYFSLKNNLTNFPIYKWFTTQSLQNIALDDNNLHSVNGSGTEGKEWRERMGKENELYLM